MTDQRKSSGFGLGMAVGTILGGLVGFFLSPKSGKQNRQMVMKKFKELKGEIEKMKIEAKIKEIWGDVTEDGKKTFTSVRKEVLAQISNLQDRFEDFDYEKYIKMVEKAIDNTRKETKQNADKLVKLKDLYVKDWQKVMGGK